VENSSWRIVYLVLLDQEVKRRLLRSLFLCNDNCYARNINLRLFEVLN